MICPKCNNQFDIYNAVIAEDKENKEEWVCPECKVHLNDSDTATTLRDKIQQTAHQVLSSKLSPIIKDEVKQATKHFVGSKNDQATRDAIMQAITDIIGEDRPFMDVPFVADEIAQNVMRIVEQNATKKEVVLSVLGGVVDVEVVPIGIAVKVRDYDVDGCDEDKLTRDEHGNWCCESIYGADVEQAPPEIIVKPRDYDVVVIEGCDKDKITGYVEVKAKTRERANVGDDDDEYLS